MKVSQNNNVEVIAGKLQHSAAQHKAAASEVVRTTAAPRHPGVPVTVSSSVRSLDQNAKTSADIDMAKVNAMRAAIANGTFRINAGAIADKLLADTSRFLSADRA